MHILVLFKIKGTFKDVDSTVIVSIKVGKNDFSYYMLAYVFLWEVVRKTGPYDDIDNYEQ